jgi:isopentenyl diphosphate isomerase/L-lactate dehydrogenase-like FMN-dependent dehydrogenase
MLVRRPPDSRGVPDRRRWAARRRRRALVQRGRRNGRLGRGRTVQGRLTGELLNVWDYERAAEERLDPAAFGYFAGGANDEWTLRENVAAFGRWVLRPRVLVDVSGTTAATSVLGTEVSCPVLVAPMAFQGLAHPEGETAMARGAAAAGTIMCLSTLSTVDLEVVATAAPNAGRWFQLYWGPDRTKVQDLAERAAAAGYRAIVVTVDLPEVGRRERDLRTGFEAPASLSTVTDNSLTWRDLEWLRERTELPILVKGILTGEDAVLATQAGVEGIVVSNHGGRQLDGVAASLDALPEVVEAVGDQAEILLDGGVRRGTDVVKALALGARAVLVGRAALYGLAVDGTDGVEQVLTLLRDEVELALALCGCAAPEDVTRAHVGRV